MQTELFVIVVSSLGAVPEETLRDLRRLVLAQANTTAKRLVAAALKGSRDIYLGRTGGRNRGGIIQRREQRGAERGEQEEGRTQHPDQEETSQTEGEDPWLPEGETEDSIDEIPEERETDDDEDAWIRTSTSDETLEETSNVEESDPPEDPATPWWDRGEPPPPEEGEDAIRRAVDALFGMEVRPIPTEIVHDQGGEPEGEVHLTGTGGERGPDQGGTQRQTTVEANRPN